MTDQILANFEQECKKVDNAIEGDKEYLELKEGCNQLFKTLREIAPQLAPYDRERYNGKVESLLKRINAKGPSTNDMSKGFRFRKKVSLKKTTPPAGGPFKSVRDKPATRTGELITIESPTASYQNLDQCTLITDPNSTCEKSGSLILQNITNGLVSLEPAPFASGSLFITECDNLTIICSTPQHNAVQIRLHNLVNSRILIRPLNPASKQVVVLENCHNCIFHQATEHQIKLQDFSELNLRSTVKHNDTKASGSYSFESFDIPQLAHR